MSRLEREDTRRRLDAIARIGVLGRAGDPNLTALARVGAYVTGAPSVGVHILDAHLQHRVAAVGAPLGSGPRSDSLCHVVVDGGERVVAPDATRDPRFAYSSNVRGDLPVRFFAGVPLRTSEGAVIGTLCAWDTVERDITEEQLARFEDLAEQVVAQVELKQIAMDLGYAAAHDPLTGAANRLVLGDRLAQAFARQLREDREIFVALVDIDDFKGINDLHGHSAGDDVLREVVRRLLGCTRVQDTVARLGGDEFAILAEYAPGRTTAEAFVGRLEAAFDAPVALDGLDLHVGVTVGGTAAHAGDGVAEALARADRLMYDRKSRRRISVP